jgi:hypothetical protein
MGEAVHPADEALAPDLAEQGRETARRIRECKVRITQIGQELLSHRTPE